MNKLRWVMGLLALGGLAGLATRLRKPEPAPEGTWRGLGATPNSNRSAGK